ncbi:MAG: hypothetical protein ACLR1M_12435 [Oscillospiraceae bacterium]
MKKELKNRMREDISGFRLPRYEQIPDVGLYLGADSSLRQFFPCAVGGGGADGIHGK